MIAENYLDRQNKLLNTLDTLLARLKPALDDWLGEGQATQLLRESHQEYQALIPRLPYIGQSMLLMFFWPPTRYLAVYRAMQRQGGTLEEAGRLVYMMGTEEVLALPPLVRRIWKYLWFSSYFTGRIKRKAPSSHERPYPGSYVIDYVEGDGLSFDYGVDYLECATCKLLQAEDAFELAPYICATDKPVSELMGWGLTRTMTLAGRDPKCDFRFKRGGETHVPVPPALQAFA